MLWWRDKKFWTCAALFLLTFLAMGQISAWGDPYDPAPYRPFFEGLTLFLWFRLLYLRWTGRWRKENGLGWGLFVLMAALPHIPFSMIGAGSWVCLGGSLLLGPWAIFSAVRK